MKAMPKTNRPACKSCGRKVTLYGGGDVCHTCMSKPPKFRVGQRVEYLEVVSYITGERKSAGVFTVSKIQDGSADNNGWSYSFLEKPRWRISEKNLREAEAKGATKMSNTTYTRDNVPEGEFVYVYPSGYGVRVRVFERDGEKVVEFNVKNVPTRMADLPGWSRFETVD